MHKTISVKIISSIIFCLIVILFLLPRVSLAQISSGSELLWGGRENQLQTLTGLGNRDIRVVIALIIRVAMGFVGIIAVIIILLAGLKWMTSGGNEEKAAEARRTLFSGIVGLILILAAFAIAQYLIDALSTATGTGTI